VEKFKTVGGGEASPNAEGPEALIFILTPRLPHARQQPGQNQKYGQSLSHDNSIAVDSLSEINSKTIA
jgi:hypothetical protein